MATFAKWFPAIVVLVFAGYIASKARMPESKPSEMQIYEFGKLPLAYQGRIKPYDTLARNSLQILSGRQEVGVIDAQAAKSSTELPAIRWLLDAISGADAADDHRIFRIENLDLLDTLGLEAPPAVLALLAQRNSARRTASCDRQVKLAEATPEKERSLFQNKVLELARQVQFLHAARAVVPLAAAVAEHGSTRWRAWSERSASSRSCARPGAARRAADATPPPTGRR